MTFAEKQVYLASTWLRGYRLRNASDVSEDGGVAQPLRINWDNVTTVAFPGPTLPDSSYPPATSISGFGGMYKDGFGAICNVYKNVNDVWTLFDTHNWPVSRVRGTDECNVIAINQADGRIYYPQIDGDSMLFTAPSGCGGHPGDNIGGSFRTPIMGITETHIEVGPHNGGELWTQFEYEPTSMVQDWGGSNTSHQVKICIYGPNPSTALNFDYIGSSPAFAGVIYYESSFLTTPTKNKLIQGYTRIDHPSGFSGVEDIDYRTVGGTVMDQTGCGCPQSVVSYSYPPCIGIENQVRIEITEQKKIQSVASDFTISGNTLTRTTDTFTTGTTGATSETTGRNIYISGVGYRRVSATATTKSCTFNGTALGSLSNQTVFISGYPNSILNRWINGVQTVANTDQRFVWEDSINGGVISGNVGFGEHMLIIQMTNKTESIAHTQGTARYRNLIFATARIPMVTDSTDPTPYPRRGTRLVFL